MSPAKCPDCDGSGKVFAEDGPLSFRCGRCGGTGETPYRHEEGEWGRLENEPCRFCRQVGGVFFLIDDGPEGNLGLSPNRCDKCRRTWVPGESTA